LNFLLFSAFDLILLFSLSIFISLYFYLFFRQSFLFFNFNSNA